MRDENGKVIQLVNIRNPWGKGEFCGDWSDNSDKWETILPEKCDQLLVEREDGAFWMCYKVEFSRDLKLQFWDSAKLRIRENSI